MNPGPHVRHIVMWNIAGASPAEKRANIERLRQGFERLRGRIPGLLQLDIGVDSSGVDYACDVVLYSEFASQAALEDYAIHPEHLQLKAELGSMRTARHQVDYAWAPLAAATETPEPPQ